MQRIPEDEPTTSTRVSNNTQMRGKSIRTLEERDEDENDNTCCHRATFCNPVLREIIVTDAISTCYELRVTWADLFWLATVTGMTLLAWTVLYFLLGDPVMPGGAVFGFFILVVSSYALGWSLTYIPRLHIPPIFGMLLAGIIMRNTDVYNIQDQLGSDSASMIRIFCVTFIMVRAGLQLTTTVLRAHPAFVMILAIVPCTVEMLTVTVSCRYLLGYPWDWSFMTGTIVACMSPVVTVGCMLILAESGYGEDKELTSLLSTATCIDTVHVVSLFAICVSVVFSNDDGRTEWWSYVPGGIRDFLLGLIAGIILGFALAFFPHRNHTTPFHKTFYFLWHVVQPILGGVIGANCDFRNWAASRFGLYLACVLAAISVRGAATFLTTVRTSFTWKERLFVAIAWMPKGSLQAALAPIAFERASKEDDPAKIELALDVVRLSIIVIVILAPLGAFAMMTSGPLLLNKISIEEYKRDRLLSWAPVVAPQFRRNRKSESSTDEILSTESVL
ncbi:mitochondrial sodium/hydrogen exchanger 9B2-like isoform X2 [Pseudomyrmex gracilis]|uniref:mitochondrial sodium/hydrogen exchanger 9B2-like isoform X2 n=1 Tax=Pseudomyrmex gracilis TaxID=219809 RepID=UPI000994ED46|nr:mitochondrial sodium/hydrogen exchanger 9B2-like isoform X2 [Pseudomyrmex gracilis]